MQSKRFRVVIGVITGFIIIFALFFASCGSPVQDNEDDIPISQSLPTEGGLWVPEMSHESGVPSGDVLVRINSVDNYVVNTPQVETVRPDVFQPGHISVFDMLLHLDGRGDIELVYHFDSSMNTHVIDSINGQANWWYRVMYDGGWFEDNVFRMDMYPVKDGTTVEMGQFNASRIAAIYQSFADEVTRLAQNGGVVIIPEVTINGPGAGSNTYYDVMVTAHNVRDDVLQVGQITALDVLLSLGERGDLSALKLTWYESIGLADPVGSYWVEQIDEDIAGGSCGFVYETGAAGYEYFGGNHIHIPSDVRVIVSPEYELWFWICL